jgi:hypothetical protein
MLRLPTHLFNDYQTFRGEADVAQVKNEWSYTSTPTIPSWQAHELLYYYYYYYL